MLNVLLTSLLAVVPDFTVTTATGSSTVGRLAELSAQRVVVETAAGRKEFATPQVVELRPETAVAARAAKVAAWIELIDGTQLAATSLSVMGHRAAVGLEDASLEIPTRAIAQVRFQEQSPKIAQQWAEIVKAPRSGDVLVIRKQDSIDYLSGVLGDVTAESVQFTLDGEQVPVKRTRVEGLLYAPPPGGVPADAFCSVVGAGGSRLAVRQAAVQGEQLRITTPAGVEFSRPLSWIAAVQFQVQYVSDLAPESATWTPYVGTAAEESPAARTFHQPRFNRGFESGKLMLGGQPYAKGLALCSRSEVVYRLPGKFSTLVALVGIDDASRPEGNVRLSIYGDERRLWEGDVTGRDPPRPISVDLQGANRLRIVVDFNGDETSDYLNLCDARILK